LWRCLRAHHEGEVVVSEANLMDQHERWQLHGTAPAAYERYLVPTMFTPWAVNLLARVALQPGARVLDVACGTGIVARLAVPQVGAAGHVTGMDRNIAMLEVAQAQTATWRPAVRWLAGDAEALPFAAATFDAVLCQQSVQFFADQARAMWEMHRVLVPGGRCALNVARSLPYNPYLRALADALEHHISPEAGAVMRAPCSLGEAETLHALLTTAGFRDIRLHVMILTIRQAAVTEFLAGQLAATPVATAVAALDAAARAALLSDICVMLQPYMDEAGLAVPYATHVAVASA
jgi:ubiquinone/menaquinone biosynthesis C-methylase UbiE